MHPPSISLRLACLATAYAVAAASVHAETVVLECTKADETQNICDSRWVIDGDAKTVTWRWCESPDTTETRNVVVTDDQITFDEDFMKRHYVIDRKTGRMTITAEAGFDGGGERFEDGVSVCKAPD